MFRRLCIVLLATTSLFACASESIDDTGASEGALAIAGGTSVEQRRHDFGMLKDLVPLGRYTRTDLHHDGVTRTTFELDLFETTKVNPGTMKYLLIVRVDKPGAAPDTAVAQGFVALEPQTASEFHFTGNLVVRFEKFSAPAAGPARETVSAFLESPYVARRQNDAQGAVESIELFKVTKGELGSSGLKLTRTR